MGEKDIVKQHNEVVQSGGRMTTYYKVTDHEDHAGYEPQWGEGITHKTDGEGELGSKHWIIAYEHPLLAMFHNPIHGHYDGLWHGHLWECTSDDAEPIREGQMRVGVRSLTTVKQLELPEFPLGQRVYYGILCALAVYNEEGFVVWAQKWLSGEDRSAGAARAAKEAIVGAVWDDMTVAMAAKYAAFAAEASKACVWSETEEFVSYAAACATKHKGDMDLLLMIKKAIRLHKKAKETGTATNGLLDVLKL